MNLCRTLLFGSTVNTVREGYDRFVMDAMDEKHRSEFHQGSDDSRILGEGRFLQQVMAQTDEEVAVKISLDELLTWVAREFGRSALGCRMAGVRDRAAYIGGAG